MIELYFKKGQRSEMIFKNGKPSEFVPGTNDRLECKSLKNNSILLGGIYRDVLELAQDTYLVNNLFI